MRSLPISLATSSLSICLLLVPACGLLELDEDDAGETGGDPEQMGTPSMTLELVGAGTGSEATQAGTVTIETSAGVQLVQVIYTVDGGNGGGQTIDASGTKTSWEVPIGFQLATAGNSYPPAQITLCADPDCALSETAAYIVYTRSPTDDGFTFIEFQPDGSTSAYGTTDVAPTPLAFGP